MSLLVVMPVFARGGKQPTYTPANCTKPRVAPRTIYIACGDGNFFVRVKRYTFYNAREAAGKGKALANDCMPSCAEGSFHRYPVKVHLTKPRLDGCGGRRVRYFHRIEVTWKKARPSPSLHKHEKYSLYCAP